MTPKLPVKITKKLKTLTLQLEKQKLILDIEDGAIDLIKLDEWITKILKVEWDKQQLRNELSGKKKILL